MGRIVFKVLVVLGFVAAVSGLYLVIRTSGVLSKSESVQRMTFSDVPQNYRHRVQIEAALERGLLTPAVADRFGLADPVTREEFAVAVVKDMGWSVGPDEKEVFADVEGKPGEVDPADYVAVIAQKNVMSGSAGDPPTFMPETPVSLEQAFRVMMRAVGNRLKEPDVPDPAIAALDVSEELKKALQVATEAKLLDGTGVTVGSTDFKKPLTKETAAVLFANVERALKGG